MMRWIVGIPALLALSVAPVALAAQTSCTTISHSLAQGSKGSDVVALQMVLSVQTTGYFGPLTKANLIQWQIAHGVIASAHSDGAGNVGPKTRAALACRAAVIPNVSAASSSSTITTITAIASTTATTTVNSSATVSTPTIQGGGSSSVQAGPMCAAIGAKAPATVCESGTAWQIIQDEAGCDIWYCVDTTNDTRG